LKFVKVIYVYRILARKMIQIEIFRYAYQFFSQLSYSEQNYLSYLRLKAQSIQ